MSKKEKCGEAKLGLCAQCGAVAILKCSNCSNAFYCHRKCQKLHWNSGHKNGCLPVMVESNSVLGRYLVATRDLKAGQIIFKEKPIVVGPKQSTEPVCLSCYRKVDGSYRCSQCNWPLCGPECEDGLDHRPECKVGQEIGSPITIKNFDEICSFYEVVLPLRCLSLKKSHPKKYEQLMDLESHQDEIKTADYYQSNNEKIVQMLRYYFMLVEFPQDQIDASEETIEKVIGILNTNAEDISFKHGEISGLYTLFSKIEHSCTPNVKIIFDEKRNMIIKAGPCIKKGQHLATTYTNILWGKVARRDHLKLNKFFMCVCPRCSDPTELETNFSALKCQGCLSGYLNSAAPLDELADWICCKCNTIMTVEEVREIVLKLGTKVEKVLETPSISSLEKFIGKALKIVHPNHFRLFNVKHTLLQIYGRQEALTPENIKKKESLCKDLLNLCVKFDPGVVRIVSYVGVILYEYHLVLMSRTYQSSGGGASAQSMKKDIENARSLLQQCVKILVDEPEWGPEARLRKLAENSLQELNALTSGHVP